jgi:hypothetical protein
MAIIKVKILAEDIRNSRYHDQSNCAITKAIRRATNNNNIQDCGHYIKTNNQEIKICKTPDIVSGRVMSMYNSIKKLYRGEISNAIGIEEPKDFEFELEIPDEYVFKS